MSFLIRTSTRRSPALFLSLRNQRAAAFGTSSIRSVLSESDNADNHADRAGKIESNKQDSVNKAKQGKGEWNPNLATNSEQAASADKDGKSMEEMQKMGEEKAKEK